MTDRIPESLLLPLSEFVAARMGLHFPRERWRDLERAMGPAARDLGFREVESCIRGLLAAPPEKHHLEVLASHLTVGETYFFRDPEIFAALEQQILPHCIGARRRIRRRLRLWSAGCCTGEEAYSLAIVLHRLLDDLREWDLVVLGTDINPRFLEKASAGVYSEWSFRQTPPEIKERHFQKTRDGKLAILPEIKRLVSFSYLNLAEDAYPALWNNTQAMDIILCRNVLMYFRPDRARKAVEGFERALVPGGWLIVSPSEISSLLFARLMTAQCPGAVLYRKDPHIEQSIGWSLQLPQAPSLPATQGGQTGSSLPLTARSETFLDRQFRFQDSDGPDWSGPEIGDCLSHATEQQNLSSISSTSSTSSPLSACTAALAARNLANQGKLAEALAWCEKALAADKLDPDCHYLRAAILQEQGETEAAALSLRRALFLDPNFVLAHFALANLLRRQGKFGPAQRHFENARTLLLASPPHQALPHSDGMTAAWLLETVGGATPPEGRA